MNHAEVNHDLAAMVEPMRSWAHIHHCRPGQLITSRRRCANLRRRTTAPANPICVIFAAVTGQRSAADYPAARNPGIDYMHDCAQVSAMAVVIDGFVMGHGCPKAR